MAMAKRLISAGVPGGMGGTFCASKLAAAKHRPHQIMSEKIKSKPWVNAAIFESLNDAQALAAFLNSRRLETRIFNDRLLQLFLFLCPPHATFRVQVRASASKVAAELLDSAPEAMPILQKAIACPSCGSLRVNYPQMTRKFFTPTVLLHLGIIFRIIHHEAYCEKCHYTWQLRDREAQEVSRLKASHH
jgi:hypothetical protein